MNSKPESNNAAKRYAISQKIKDNFYAIHHVQRYSSKENEPTIKKEVRDVEFNDESKKLSHHSGYKRMDMDLTTSPENGKRKRSRQQQQQQQQQKSRHQNSLFQTCTGLWPSTSPHLGDMSYNYIKSISDLLKVRLCQAKFKMMSKFEQDHELFHFLSEEYIPPKPVAHTVRLITNQHFKSTLAVIGNGKNLFSRQKSAHKYHRSYLADSPMMNENESMMTSPQRQTNKTPRHKKRTPKTPTMPKVRRMTTTLKRRSAAADVMPVTLSDGSCYYVCEPCNKKYKNRNGLAYHLERCKNAVSKQLSEDTSLNTMIGNSISGGSGSGGSTVEEEDEEQQRNLNFICTETKSTTIIECEKCNSKIQIDSQSTEIDKDAYCSKCMEPELSEANQVGKDLLQCLLDASDRLQHSQTTSSQASDVEHHNQQLQDLFNQIATPVKDDSDLFPEFIHQNEDEELFSVITTPANNEDNDGSEAGLNSQTDIHDYLSNSSQLHIWDDFNVNSNFDENTMSSQQDQQWSSMLEEDDHLFSNYDTDLPSSSLNMSDLHIFSQPPSLLFSDTTMNSSHEDEQVPVSSTLNELSPTPIITIAESSPMGDDTTPVANSNTPICDNVITTTDTANTPGASSSSTTNTPTIHSADGLWFQFANFDDDYQCEN
ncbi:uncharacterized protein BX663DRAFT_302390 [Cokeromyces recurvatus]|uniref:uncharacterized protein n=1 Tax=Cokeromyces recurvatus TaxID=90255 RepID=UPI002220ABCE|nr:uncharacterized protein BX663DRAFT_302390 [Cokeromyces recurvatus]KAI7897582.1 hypothetical protein BX663DRAFT_302390 [Cokeromyces recurvatus]